MRCSSRGAATRVLAVEPASTTPQVGHGAGGRARDLERLGDAGGVRVRLRLHGLRAEQRLIDIATTQRTTRQDALDWLKVEYEIAKTARSFRAL